MNISLCLFLEHHEEYRLHNFSCDPIHNCFCGKWRYGMFAQQVSSHWQISTEYWPRDDIRDCATKHEHLCNMQNGMWTKNYILIPNQNGTFDETLDSCSCCFLPDVFRVKASQRSLLESVISLESSASYLFASRPKPCSPLRRSCMKTADCCTGYCTVTDDDNEGGFCNDPHVLKDQEMTRLDFSGSRSKARGQKYFADSAALASISSSSSSSSMLHDSDKKNDVGNHHHHLKITSWSNIIFLKSNNGWGSIDCLMMYLFFSFLLSPAHIRHNQINQQNNHQTGTNITCIAVNYSVRLYNYLQFMISIVWGEDDVMWNDSILLLLTCCLSMLSPPHDDVCKTVWIQFKLHNTQHM